MLGRRAEVPVGGDVSAAGMETNELWSSSRVVLTSKVAPDWLHKSEQPIRSQVRKLTQTFDMTTTQEFPLQSMSSTSLFGRQSMASLNYMKEILEMRSLIILTKKNILNQILQKT